MKYLPLVFVLSILTFNLSAQQEELESIQKVLNDYMVGGQERDGDRVVSAFHETADMKMIRDGAYQEVNAQEFFGDPKPGPKLNREHEIVMVDITGHVAIAKLKLIYPERVFTDYMTLMKIKGQWKIVNKAFYLERL